MVNDAYHMASDMRLLVRVRQENDVVAFRTLYERYWERLYVHAYAKLKSGADASDLVQEIFVKLWEKRGELEVRESLQGYLFVALKHSILNHYKQLLVRRQHLAILAQPTASALRYDQPNAYKELEEQISLEVGQLPDRMREVFLLSRNQHLTAREIAHRLSISEQTVRNQISDALRRIRLSLWPK